MPTIVIKPDPDTDLYATWSTVVDAPTWVGTRAELLAELIHDPPTGRSAPDVTPRQAAEARLNRADKTGTSAFPEFGFGGWDDDTGFVVGNHEGFPGAGSRWLPRGNLTAYLTALRDGQCQAAYDLTEHIDDDEPGDPCA